MRAVVVVRGEVDERDVWPYASCSGSAGGQTTLSVTPSGTGSLVTWTMTGEKTFATKVMGVFTSMDKMVGPDFEKGLARLKARTEQPA